MPVVVNQVRVGFYLDSVALMRVSRAVAGAPGVEEAALMMATPANKQIMADAGVLSADGEAAGPGDLVLAVRAADTAAADAALTQATDALTKPRQHATAVDWHPRTIAQAAGTLPGANVALISVPGDFAVSEARKALAAGLHAMIFSDNVPVDQERALKEDARGLGKLVMGPDCGTAIIGGMPLAFANVVRPGDIAIIGASGTGTQEVSCQIDQGGGGVSHAIGVGGRDLKDAVGGITTLMALDALDADPATRHIVLVSKPPSAQVAETVLNRIAASAKPFTVCFIGAAAMDMPANATQAHTLEDAANLALGRPVAPPASFAPGVGAVAGLFAGGTLCAEAQALLIATGLAVSSNTPIPGAATLADTGHRLIDLGDDEYTQGRPHPMIDPSVRDAALAQALDDPAVTVILTDLVLGYGAHPDPAEFLIQSVGADPQKPVLTSVTGTDADPQNRAGQVAKLQRAGIQVAPSNAAAVRLAMSHLSA